MPSVVVSERVKFKPQHRKKNKGITLHVFIIFIMFLLSLSHRIAIAHNYLSFRARIFTNKELLYKSSGHAMHESVREREKEMNVTHVGNLNLHFLCVKRDDRARICTQKMLD